VTAVGAVGIGVSSRQNEYLVHVHAHLVTRSVLSFFVSVCVSSIFVQAKKKKAPPPAPRFEIKKWNAVAMWSWDICADTVSLASRRGQCISSIGPLVCTATHCFT